MSDTNVITLEMPNDPDEQYPLGKQLWFAICASRNRPQEDAEGDWKYWQEGFKKELQKAAVLFLKAHGVTP